MEWEKKPVRNINPYTKTPMTAHGLKSESRVLKNMDAKPMIGSGSKELYKSDGVKELETMDLRIECKSTINKSISLKHEWLKKIRKEALETGMTPAVTISFVTPDGKNKNAGDWLMIPLYLAKEVFDKLEEG